MTQPKQRYLDYWRRVKESQLKLSKKVILIATFTILTSIICYGIISHSGIKKPLPDKSSQAILSNNTIVSQKVTPKIPPKTTSDVPKQFQGVIIESVKLKTPEKLIALTFDDGPAPTYTSQILAILKKNNIKSTFFFLGKMVQSNPQLAKQVVKDGHALGNHTWHHWYHQMDAATAKKEIEQTTDIIYKTTAVKTTLMRPPGGILKNGLVDYAKKQKYTTVMWSSDSKDFTRPGVERLVSRVLRSAKPGGIVLLHDGGGPRSQTVQALPIIISNLKTQGYKFVTIPELLAQTGVIVSPGPQ